MHAFPVKTGHFAPLCAWLLHCVAKDTDLPGTLGTSDPGETVHCHSCLEPMRIGSFNRPTHLTCRLLCFNSVENMFTRLIHQPSIRVSSNLIYSYLYPRHNDRVSRGVATVGISVYIAPRTVEVNFLWGKNDFTTAIGYEH